MEKELSIEDIITGLVFVSTNSEDEETKIVCDYAAAMLENRLSYDGEEMVSGKSVTNIIHELRRKNMTPDMLDRKSGWVILICDTIELIEAMESRFKAYKKSRDKNSRKMNQLLESKDKERQELKKEIYRQINKRIEVENKLIEASNQICSSCNLECNPYCKWYKKDFLEENEIPEDETNG